MESPSPSVRVFLWPEFLHAVFVRTISFCSQTWRESASIIIWLVATPQERRLSWRARPLREIVVLKYNVSFFFFFFFFLLFFFLFFLLLLYALSPELLIFLQPVLFSRCISITECACETDVFLVKVRARAQNFRDYSSEYEPSVTMLGVWMECANRLVRCLRGQGYI